MYEGEIAVERQIDQIKRKEQVQDKREGELEKGKCIIIVILIGSLYTKRRTDLLSTQTRNTR